MLTLEETAALLRLPVEALRARVAAGEVPGRAFGREWRFSRAALLDWLADCEGAGRTGGRAAEVERTTGGRGKDERTKVRRG